MANLMAIIEVGGMPNMLKKQVVIGLETTLTSMKKIIKG